MMYTLRLNPAALAVISEALAVYEPDPLRDLPPAEHRLAREHLYRARHAVDTAKPAAWWEDHQEIATLLAWLTGECEITTLDAAVYMVEKPWKYQLDRDRMLEDERLTEEAA